MNDKEIKEMIEEKEIDPLLQPRKKDNITWLVMIIIGLSVMLFIAVFTRGFTTFEPVSQKPSLQGEYPIDQAVQKAMNHINTRVLQPGVTAIMINATQESDVYRFYMIVNNLTYDSYVTKDAKLLFPVSLRINDTQ